MTAAARSVTPGKVGRGERSPLLDGKNCRRTLLPTPLFRSRSWDPAVQATSPNTARGQVPGRPIR